MLASRWGAFDEGKAAALNSSVSVLQVSPLDPRLKCPGFSTKHFEKCCSNKFCLLAHSLTLKICGSSSYCGFRKYECRLCYLFFFIAPPLLVVWTQIKYKQSQINGLTHRIWLIITDFFFIWLECMHCKLTYNFIFSKSEKLRLLIDIILLIFWPLMDHETVKRERGRHKIRLELRLLPSGHVACSRLTHWAKLPPIMAISDIFWRNKVQAFHFVVANKTIFQ